MSGIVLTGTGIGVLIVPPVANRLISMYDWRISYIVVGSVVLVVIVLAAQFLRRDPSQMGQVPYGASEEEQGLNLGTGEFSLNNAVYTKQFWMVTAMFFSLGFCMFAFMVHIVPHATELGISPASAASVLAVAGGLVIAGRIVLGTAADRIGNRPIFIIGFILMSGAFLWLMPATELWMLYLTAIAYGLAQGGMGAAESPLLAELFGLSSLGLILGVTSLGITIGGALGPFLAGYIFDVTGSYQVAFLVNAAVGIVGFMVTILLKPTRGKWRRSWNRQQGGPTLWSGSFCF